MTPDPGKADPGSSTAAESTQPINTIVDTTSPPELFRGAEVLKEVFLAIREETFDIALDRIEIWKGETFHLFDPVEGASHTNLERSHCLVISRSRALCCRTAVAPMPCPA